MSHFLHQDYQKFRNLYENKFLTQDADLSSRQKGISINTRQRSTRSKTFDRLSTIQDGQPKSIPIRYYQKISTEQQELTSRSQKQDNHYDTHQKRIHLQYTHDHNTESFARCESRKAKQQFQRLPQRKFSQQSKDPKKNLLTMTYIARHNKQMEDKIYSRMSDKKNHLIQMIQELRGKTTKIPTKMSWKHQSDTDFIPSAKPNILAQNKDRIQALNFYRTLKLRQGSKQTQSTRQTSINPENTRTNGVQIDPWLVIQNDY